MSVDLFYLYKQCISGLHCLQKYLIRGFQNTMDAHATVSCKFWPNSPTMATSLNRKYSTLGSLNLCLSLQPHDVSREGSGESHIKNSSSTQIPSACSKFIYTEPVKELFLPFSVFQLLLVWAKTVLMHMFISGFAYRIFFKCKSSKLFVFRLKLNRQCWVLVRPVNQSLNIPNIHIWASKFITAKIRWRVWH